MSNVYCLNLSQKHTGLSNQLNSLLSTICHCIQSNKNIIIIDKFLSEIHTDKYAPISYIIDINQLNLYLKKYKICLIDGCFIQYSNLFNQTFINNIKYIPGYCWDIIKDPLFIDITNEIYKNLCFNNKFIILSNSFIHTLNIMDNDNVNIIHLRIEPDGLDHWSKMNNCNIPEFKLKLINRYIELIDRLINKTDKTIILSYDSNNEIIDYLKNNGYNYYYHEKNKNDNREENAIIDLLNSKYCNNVFIGVGGSTFSETISKMINFKCIEFFDINNL
jgi:hypothetical protein